MASPMTGTAACCWRASFCVGRTIVFCRPRAWGQRGADDRLLSSAFLGALGGRQNAIVRPTEYKSGRPPLGAGRRCFVARPELGGGTLRGEFPRLRTVAHIHRHLQLHLVAVDRALILLHHFAILSLALHREGDVVAIDLTVRDLCRRRR